MEPSRADNPAIPLPPVYYFPLSVQKDALLWSDEGDSNFDGITNAKKLVTISFLNGTDIQKAKVKRYARDWRKGAPIIRYRYTYGIHGRVRVAFDDPQVPLTRWQQLYWDQIKVPYERTVDKLVFAYIGREALRAIDTPENVHIGTIDPSNAKASTDEKMFIHHAFGHTLGLDFAGALPNDDWIGTVAPDVSRKLDWLQSGFQDMFKNQQIIDPDLQTPSVMEFGWPSDITERDLAAVAFKYPIPAHIVRSSIRDLAEKSVSHEEDLDLYVGGWDYKLYKNRRIYRKKKPLDRPDVTWSYWDDVFEESLPNDLPPPLGIPEDFPTTPPNPDTTRDPTQIRDFAILDVADRLEILAVDPAGNFRFKQLMKANNEWGEWKKPDPKPAVKLGENVKKVKIIEVEGGYEVIFQRDDGKLGHFTRKSGDPELPQEYHPIPVPGNAKVDRIVAARVGPPSNPIKIYASAADDLYVAELDQKLLTWKLTNVEANKVEGRKYQIAFGMAGTTENAFVIADEKLWHNRCSDGGWFEWTQHLDGVKVSNITIGESSSKDSESRYLQVFVLDTEGKLYYNRIHEEGFWNPSPDIYRNPGSQDVKENDKWIRVHDDDQADESFFGLSPNDPLPKDGIPYGFTPIYGPPPRGHDIYSKRAKSGDLQVFLVSRDPSTNYQIYCLNIDVDGFRNDRGEKETFVPRVWGSWDRGKDY